MRSLHSKRHKESFSFSISASRRLGWTKPNSTLQCLNWLGQRAFDSEKPSTNITKYQHITSLPTRPPRLLEFALAESIHQRCSRANSQQLARAQLRDDELKPRASLRNSATRPCIWQTLQPFGRRITLMLLRALRLTWFHFTKCCHRR